ncbi:MAG: DNA polymerase III subunit delta, partial [Candidatus Binataceae bacterium]
LSRSVDGWAMAAESALQFTRSLDGSRPPPAAVVIAGPQAFLREFALRALRRSLLAQGYQYRAVQLGGAEGIGAVLDELSGADLFAPKKLVACRVLKSRREAASDDDDGAGSNAGSARGADAVLAEAIENVRAPIALALLFERDAPPAAVKRAAEKSALLVNCQRPFENQLDQYYREFARAEGLELAADGAEHLVTRFGSDLAGAANAISKSAITIAGATKLDAQSLREPAGARTPALFELSESISLGRGSAALARYDRAVALGRDPMELFGVEIVPVLRRMMTAAAMLARRKSPAEIAAALGMSPQSSLATRAIDGARRLGPSRLQRALARATEVDQGVKNGTIRDRRHAISALLLELLTV